MNPFEEAIENCPYYPDWKKMRDELAHICENFVQNPECKWYHIYEKKIDNIVSRFIVFYIYDFLYVWMDLVKDGLLECSQLDKPYSDINVEVLYSNVDNAPPAAPILFKLIDNGEITQIC